MKIIIILIIIIIIIVPGQLEMLQNSAGVCWYNKTNEQMVEGTRPAQGIKCKAFEI